MPKHSQILRHLIGFFAALLFTSPALATGWHRAESTHYVIHAELPQEDLRILMQEAEDFRRLLQILFPSEAKQGRKLQLYLDRNTRRIEWALQMRSSGFSEDSPEFAGAFAYFRRLDGNQYGPYAIYFQQTQYYINGSFYRTLPPWVLAGVPATFAPSRRDESGAFKVGVPNLRSPLINGIDGKAIRAALKTEYATRNNYAYSVFYRRSREMARVLLFDDAHAGRMDQYLDKLTMGASLAEAADQLGDLNALSASVKRLRANGANAMRVVSLPIAPPVTIEVRAMTQDEVDLVALRFTRLVGSRPKTVNRRLRKLTQKHANSADVWHEYAASEYERVRKSLFGGEPNFRGFGFSNNQIIVPATTYSDRLAWAAVNRALELDPDHAPARILKAEITIGRLLKADLDEDLSEEFAALRRELDPLAAQPETYPLAAAVAYQSYLEEGIDPPRDALDRLGRAFLANRGVKEFRYAYASALARIGEREAAEVLLRAMLFDPAFREAAQAAIDQQRPQ
ncbi:MAG: hypothetical protein AAGB23_05925 [Pseudomonadota bacterium]